MAAVQSPRVGGGVASSETEYRMNPSAYSVLDPTSTSSAPRSVLLLSRATCTWKLVDLYSTEPSADMCLTTMTSVAPARHAHSERRFGRIFLKIGQARI